jgi:predicted flap endonuclease-1-like 5' DNA nuclease
MKIEFLKRGPVRRLVGSHEWSDKAGWVQDIPAQLAAELLTAPQGEFKISADEPLLEIQGIGPARALELAVAGIGTVMDLAGLDTAGIKRIAAETRASVQQVRDWAAQARQMTKINTVEV